MFIFLSVGIHWLIYLFYLPLPDAKSSLEDVSNLLLNLFILVVLNLPLFILLLILFFVLSNIQYNSKNVEELESLLSSLDTRMKADIDESLENALREKDELIEILMERELDEVKRKYASEKEEIQAEVQRRETAK